MYRKQRNFISNIIFVGGVNSKSWIVESRENINGRKIIPTVPSMNSMKEGKLYAQTFQDLKFCLVNAMSFLFIYLFYVCVRAPAAFVFFF